MRKRIVWAALSALALLSMRDLPAVVFLQAGGWGGLELLGPDRYLPAALNRESRGDELVAWAQRRLGRLLPGELVQDAVADGGRIWVATEVDPDHRRLWLLDSRPWRVLDASAPLECNHALASINLGDIDGDGVREAMLSTFAGTAAVGHLFRRHGDTIRPVPGPLIARYGFDLRPGAIAGWRHACACCDEPSKILWTLREGRLVESGLLRPTTHATFAGGASPP